MSPKEIRNNALEEAAKIAEQRRRYTRSELQGVCYPSTDPVSVSAHWIADDIRALMTPKEQAK